MQPVGRDFVDAGEIALLHLSSPLRYRFRRFRFSLIFRDANLVNDLEDNVSTVASAQISREVVFLQTVRLEGSFFLKSQFIK